MMCVFPSLSFFLGLQCSLPPSVGRPTLELPLLYLTPNAVRRHVAGLVPRHHAALAVLERDKGAVAELENPFLLLVDLLVGE